MDHAQNLKDLERNFLAELNKVVKSNKRKKYTRGETRFY